MDQLLSSCSNETFLQPEVSSPILYSSCLETIVTISGILAVCSDINDSSSWVRITIHRQKSKSVLTLILVMLQQQQLLMLALESGHDSLITANSHLLQLNSTHAFFTVNITQSLITARQNYCVLVTPVNVPGCISDPPPPYPPWSTICHPHVFSLSSSVRNNNPSSSSCFPQPGENTLRKVLLLIVTALAFIILMISSSVTSCYLSSCLLYTSPSPRDKRQSRMPSSA